MAVRIESNNGAYAEWDHIGDKRAYPVFGTGGIRTIKHPQDWGWPPTTVERFEQEFGREAAQHWALRRTPASAEGFSAALKSIWAKDIAARLNEPSSLIATMDALRVYNSTLEKSIRFKLDPKFYGRFKPGRYARIKARLRRRFRAQGR